MQHSAADELTNCTKPSQNQLLVLFFLFGYVSDNRRFVMVFHPILMPIVSLIAGILILFFPAILNYVVAFYLIIVGIMGIVGRAM